MPLETRSQARPPYGMLLAMKTVFSANWSKWFVRSPRSFCIGIFVTSARQVQAHSQNGGPFIND